MVYVSVVKRPRYLCGPLQAVGGVWTASLFFSLLCRCAEHELQQQPETPDPGIYSVSASQALRRVKASVTSSSGYTPAQQSDDASSMLEKGSDNERGGLETRALQRSSVDILDASRSARSGARQVGRGVPSRLENNGAKTASPERTINPGQEHNLAADVHRKKLEGNSRLRELVGGYYPWGMTAAAYGAYLNWYRAAYLPWYYATYGAAVAPPVVTSPAVYAAYPAIAAPVATAAAVPVQAAVPVAQQTIVPVARAEAVPVMNRAAAAVAEPVSGFVQRTAVPVLQQTAIPAATATPVTGYATMPVAQVASNEAALTPAAVATPAVSVAPTEALLSLDDRAYPGDVRQTVVGAPVTLLTAPYANGYGNTRAGRGASRTSGGVGGLGVSNFAAFLARPDGTLAAIGGNGV
ncbi:hypothetical protein BESB_063630 [Besnoitia besnoiti]|uniref:Uncharacterized protein n=1 Tax=Besnoitia besnoiti TaxID=94643 RepID=A0A2A9MHQ2_BESBE|nr:hypothetical protein BESB_063630 [Besnoitia besnoiti]PFH35476.1 hypothetical protein BESB_063630 [Besnoitia besnoiti]